MTESFGMQLDDDSLLAVFQKVCCPEVHASAGLAVRQKHVCLAQSKHDAHYRQSQCNTCSHCSCNSIVDMQLRASLKSGCSMTSSAWARSHTSSSWMMSWMMSCLPCTRAAHADNCAACCQAAA